ncbi:N-acetyltransferase family protein [Nonomuraea sp. NPDC003727]
MTVELRPAVPGDYGRIAAVVDDWWGRQVLPLLPRLFLDHFHRTSLVAERPGGELAGFLIGFLSPAQQEEAYIHFVGVSPEARAAGLGRTLYDRFFALARADGRSRVKAVTSPGNAASIAFHRRMGFTAAGPVTGYDGPGIDLVVFERAL